MSDIDSLQTHELIYLLKILEQLIDRDYDLYICVKRLILLEEIASADQLQSFYLVCRRIMQIETQTLTIFRNTRQTEQDPHKKYLLMKEIEPIFKRYRLFLNETVMIFVTQIEKIEDRGKQQAYYIDLMSKLLRIFTKDILLEFDELWETANKMEEINFENKVSTNTDLTPLLQNYNNRHEIISIVKQKYDELSEFSKNQTFINLFRFRLESQRSIFYTDVMKDMKTGYDIAKNAFDNFILLIETVTDDVLYKDLVLEASILRDNLYYWQSLLDEQQNQQNEMV